MHTNLNEKLKNAGFIQKNLSREQQQLMKDAASFLVL